MSLDSVLADLNAEAEKIKAYEAECEAVLEGANNQLAFNPGPPSHDVLQEQIRIYEETLNQAGDALRAIADTNASFAQLAEKGYPALPTVTGSPEALADLDADQAKNQKSRAQIVPAASSTVTGTVGEERPTENNL